MPGLPAALPCILKSIPALLILTQRAAGTHVYVASSPDFDISTGVSGTLFPRDRDVRTKQITYDANVAVRLWNISEAPYQSRTVLRQTG